MNRLQLVNRVKSLTRDFTGSIFRENDMVDFVDEGIDRVRQVIPELSGMVHLVSTTSEVALMPDSYHYLLAIYSASRCFSQDESQYQATVMMNEFETKLLELKNGIQSGEIILIGVDVLNVEEFVETKSYWGNYRTGTFDDDIDLGVEGVE